MREIKILEEIVELGILLTDDRTEANIRPVMGY